MGSSHPYLFKWVEKDRTHSNQYNSQNVVAMRYALTPLCLFAYFIYTFRHNIFIRIGYILIKIIKT